MPGLKLVSRHALTPVPLTRAHRLNANAFQQDAIINHNGWQYVVFYSAPDGAPPAPSGGDGGVGVSRLLVNISRRPASALDAWDTITFTDYEQVTDDGHNTISMGICPGDGTIHISFDHHCVPLRYRLSQPGVANDPTSHPWTAALFGPVLHQLPGTGLPLDLFLEVSYPRFLAVPSGLLFSFRIGMAGAGSDVLFKYVSETGAFIYVGMFLVGVQNNPYVNGLSYARDIVHVSGCYRGFVAYEGAGDPASTAHKVNAGPNGPENNYGLFYVRSADEGQTWQNTHGQTIASLANAQSILPDAEGLVVFDIPRDSGIMNQESQAGDDFGGFHVLNRENRVWIHYYRSLAGTWSKNPLLQAPRPTNTGLRGRIVAVEKAVYLVLPGNTDSSLTILACEVSETGVGPYQVVWAGDGFDGEPHVSIMQNEDAWTLSVFTTAVTPQREVVVLDLRKSND